MLRPADYFALDDPEVSALFEGCTYVWEILPLLAAHVARLAPDRRLDGEIMPGVTAMLAPGHTPGHTNWLIRSGADRLLIWGDIVHLASVQMARPDCTLVFDVDPQTARATRERVLGFAASEQLVVAGAHLPFPGFGRVGPAGTGFSHRPEA